MEEGETSIIVDESGDPWEKGPGYVKLVGAAEPLSDDKRARLTGTLLSGAEEITEDEALRITAERDAKRKDR